MEEKINESSLLDELDKLMEPDDEIKVQVRLAPKLPDEVPIDIIVEDDEENSSSILKEYEEQQSKIDEIKVLINKLKEEHKEVFDKLDLYSSMISQCESEQGNIKKRLCTQMEKENLKNLSSSRFKVVYYSPSVAHKLMDSFKKDYPDLYEEYTTKTEKSSYVKVSEVKN